MESDLANEEEIIGIVEDQLIPKPVDLSYYARDHIQDYHNITEIPQENLNYLNSGLVANSMGNMFYSCNNLQSVPKLNIDTSQCTDMSGMFNTCQALTTIDLSHFDTSNVTIMNSIFYFCQKLTTIDLSNWDTSNVAYMGNMFNNCRALTTVDLSNFNTSNVTDMGGMFYYCQALTSLNLSSFNTSKVINMSNMFNRCRALEHIEGIIDMKSCTSYGSMFNQCTKLSGVKIKNPPQAYYDNKTQFESDIGLTSDKYEIVS